jgi:release factor glutamine methyltransferase
MGAEREQQADAKAQGANFLGNSQPEPGKTGAGGTPGLRFDLLVSNPPYIPSAEIATLQPEVRDFDPRVALDGGADGLDFYRRLATGARAFLKPDGKIMLEFGDGQAEALRKIFETEKWIVEAVKEDYSHRARILIAKPSSFSSSSS